jgi:hypothetical protein
MEIQVENKASNDTAIATNDNRNSNNNEENEKSSKCITTVKGANTNANMDSEKDDNKKSDHLVISTFLSHLHIPTHNKYKLHAW